MVGPIPNPWSKYNFVSAVFESRSNGIVIRIWVLDSKDEFKVSILSVSKIFSGVKISWSASIPVRLGPFFQKFR